MPVEFLTNEQVAAYGRFVRPLSRTELERCFLLNDRERELVEQRRRPHNRLGFAVQVGTVRFLGTFLADPLQRRPCEPAYVIPLPTGRVERRDRLGGVLREYSRARPDEVTEQGLTTHQARAEPPHVQSQARQPELATRGAWPGPTWTASTISQLALHMRGQQREPADYVRLAVNAEGSLRHDECSAEWPKKMSLTPRLCRPCFPAQEGWDGPRA